MTRVVPSLLALIACAAPPEPPPAPVRVQECVADPSCRRPLVAAHSANPMFGPGNSETAYRASIDQGADLLETDIRVTADGVPVLLHDDELSKQTDDCDALVSESTLEAVKRCTLRPDEGSGVVLYDPDALPPQHPVTLEELVDMSGGRALVVAEIKSDSTNAALRLVLAKGWTDRVLFLADTNEAANLRAVSTDAWILLRTRSAAEVDAALADDDPRIPAFHGDTDWTDAGVLERIHAGGRKAWINTFSNFAEALAEFGGEERCSSYWDRGFDLVQTNRADLCVTAARARGGN